MFQYQHLIAISPHQNREVISMEDEEFEDEDEDVSYFLNANSTFPQEFNEILKNCLLSISFLSTFIVYLSSVCFTIFVLCLYCIKLDV